MRPQWRQKTFQAYICLRNFSSRPTIMSRTYADAVASLNTLQTNFSIINAIQNSRQDLNKQAIPEMIEWCQKIGYEPSDLNRLNPIHIAGTKGKGSTSAFISSILTQHVGTFPTAEKDEKPLSKVGLYTSPHLRFVRERISINMEPLSEEQFAHYFFETWDRLEGAARAAGHDPKDRAAKPMYFRFLTLMAFHTFMSEGIDVAVIECGIGGEYDSTNVLVAPIVTGITSLGIDHVGILGNSLEEIAWHKAGIMKAGARCFTSTGQRDGALRILEERARDVHVELKVVEIDEDIKTGKTKLGLAADFQKMNASLAVAIAQEWLIKKGFEVNNKSISDQVKKGLEEVKWGGRCETRHEKDLTWYIDGGHTLESIELAGKWFAEQVHSHQKAAPGEFIRVLIFNQQTRDAGALAKALHDTLAKVLEDQRPFTHAIFCTNTTFQATGFRPDLTSLNTDSSALETLRVQKDLAKMWEAIDPGTDVKVVRTIEEAVQVTRKLVIEISQKTRTMAFVTGSLHLVGGFLEVLESGSSTG